MLSPAPATPYASPPVYSSTTHAAVLEQPAQSPNPNRREFRGSAKSRGTRCTRRHPAPEISSTNTAATKSRNLCPAPAPFPSVSPLHPPPKPALCTTGIHTPLYHMTGNAPHVPCPSPR